MDMLANGSDRGHTPSCDSRVVRLPLVHPPIRTGPVPPQISAKRIRRHL